MARRMSLLTATTLALLLVASAVSQSHSPRVSLLPTCGKIQKLLPEPQAARLRDLIQLESQVARKGVYWSELQLRLKTPPTDESEKIAFITNFTAAHVAERVAENTMERGIATQKVEEFLFRLKSQYPDLKPHPDSLVRACAMGRMNTHLYEYRPRVSLLLQYFKRPHMIQPYIERMQACKAAGAPIELIVNVDHPADHEQWAWASYNTSGLVVPVFSNNLHEIRAYNRMLHIARGDIVVFMADDDLPPTAAGCAWILMLTTLFDRWPNTGIVGLRNYQHCYDEGPTNKGAWFKDAITGLHAHWVQRVDMSPMAFRKTALLHVGGMDETMSEPGMCGIVSDWEVCHRMWTAGWEVMASMPLPLEHDFKEEGGTHKPASAYKCWGLQMGTAGEVMKTHGAQQWEDEMCQAARRLNLERLQLVDAASCPYKKGCQL